MYFVYFYFFVFFFIIIFIFFYIQNAFTNNDDHHMTIQIIGRQRCSLISPLMQHNVYMEDISITICNDTNVRVLDEQILPKQIIKFPESSINRLSENEVFLNF